MNIDFEKTEEYIKTQAQVFLLELGTFYPFGCAIDKMYEAKPLEAYLEGKSPSVIELVDLLEKSIDQKLKKEDYLIAGIAIDVTIKEEDGNHDAIEVRVFKKIKNNIKSTLNIK